ncbi:hypothetical protein BASA81_012489 [Batrachochytrium salamandrivorans]|nr:hypothetical protein BASA81_012489 [Batrachochytrium salamandrivorans]
MSFLTRALHLTLVIEPEAFLPYLAILIHSFVTISLFVFMSATTAFLILGPYNANPMQLGSIMGQLSVADEVLVLGYMVTTLSLFMLPMGQVWSPDLLLTRMLFAFGTSCLSSILAAMLADVVQPKGLPRATALAGIMSGVGALVAAYGYLGLGATYCMKIAYFIVGGICGILGTVVCLLYMYAKPAEDKPTIKQVVVGFGSVPKLAWQNPFLGLAILGSFGARMTSTVGSLFLSSWFQNYMMYESRECPMHGDPALYANATITFCGMDSRCAKAVSAAAATNGILQTLALVGAPIAAVFVEFLPDTTYGMFMACTISAFAFSFMVTVPNPHAKNINGVAAGMGLGQIFMIISTQVMLVRNISSPGMRGTLSAAYSIVGALGVITVSVGGGDMIDAGFNQGPFLITGIVCAILGAFCLVLIGIYRPTNNRNQPKITDEVAVIGDLQKPAAVVDESNKA